MEPTEINFPSDEDRRFEAWLREAQPELSDDGFSRRVLLALPRKKPAFHLSSRFLLCALGGAIGLVVAVRQGVTTPNEIDPVVSRLNETIAAISPFVMNPQFLLALGVTGVSLLIAFGPSNVRRLVWK